MSTNSFVLIADETGELKPVRYDRFVQQIFKPDNIKDSLSHLALGVAGEAGELVDALKKHVVYGKPLDVEHVREELGDLRYYMEQICSMLDISDQEVLQGNANKLAVRYKSMVYSSEDAIARADKPEGE